MAERLTEFNKTGWVLKLDEPQNEFEARQQLMRKFKLACEKLGKLEDILEKYDIESFELLEHIIKKGMVINSTIEDFAKEKYDKIKKDRELVKEVCDEIARNVRVRKIKKEWYAIETDLRAILDQIQKEFEDGE